MSREVFTKGEWKVKWSLSGNRMHEIVSDNGRIAFIHFLGEDTTEEANANLIAAAPRMHEALTIALPFIDNNEVKGIMREALLKAESKQ